MGGAAGFAGSAGGAGVSVLGLDAPDPPQAQRKIARIAAGRKVPGIFNAPPGELAEETLIVSGYERGEKRVPVLQFRKFEIRPKSRGGCLPPSRFGLWFAAFISPPGSLQSAPRSSLRLRT